LGYKFRPELYIRPKTINETTETLMKHGKNAMILAGGTDLLVSMPEEAKVLVDINSLNLSYIKESGNRIYIGATTTFKTLNGSPLLQRQPYKVVSDAAWELGHYNLRNIATVGGNICNAVPSADAPVALIALDTNTTIAGPKGERTTPLDGFFKFVRETTLGSGEFLKELIIPPQPRNTAASFQKIGRTKVDIAIVNAACRLTVENGVIKDSRIVLGAVAPTPIRVIDAEKKLNGKEISPEIVEKVAETAAEATKPIDDVRSSAQYRHEMSKVLTRRTILDAYEKAMEISI
jgi:CO/xanthine dehydrogenase FAD-binding subunit